MKILVTGSCGYKGTVLVPRLLASGHSVIAYDVMWFGNFLKPHPMLTVLSQDIRDKDFSLDGVECVIHLASVANDPCADLSPTLTWEISCLATQQLMDKAARSGVETFIYASSGSVYGVKSENNVVEDLPLDPISVYNKTKMVAERVLLSYASKMRVVIVRPATVCGFSPRMRFDVAVNLLTIQALENQKITVFGGNQVRPNIHIEDIVSVYEFFLNQNSVSGIFNAGFENISILEIAEKVQNEVPCEIIITPSNDPRSYRMDSSKLLDLGFQQKHSVSDAIIEIKTLFEAGKICNKAEFNNLTWMKENVAV